MANIYISLGSNIERRYHVKQGLIALSHEFSESIDSFSLSSLFESAAVGFDGTPFYNMVIGIETPCNIDEVTDILRKIEYSHGRTADAKKFSPRTLDLDLLLYNNLITDKPAQIPRDEITTNAFILWPLSQIAPELEHPIIKKCYQDLWQNYDKSKQQIKIIDRCW